MNLEEIAAALNKTRVRYLLIGGHASIVHGVPRTTIDVDIAVDPAAANVKKCIGALKSVGMTCDTECTEDILGQGGITFSNDRDVDVLTTLPGGEEFGPLWKDRIIVKYKGININVISRKDQVRLLKKAARKRDLEDIECLEN